MHSLRIILFSLVPVLGLFGQDNFVPGKVTMFNGEKLDGNINYLYWKSTPLFIQFKNNKGEITKLYPENVQDFRIGEKAIYISRLVEYDSVGNKVEVSNDKNPSYKKKHVFLKVLFEASKSLLVYSIDVDHFFIQYEDRVKELVNHHYKVKVGNNFIPMENRLYFIELSKVFGDCKTLQITNKLAYTEKALGEVFSNYASCKGEQGRLFRKKEKTIVTKGMVGTIAYDEMRKGFKGGVGFGVGPSLNVYFPYRVYKYSLHNELVYRMFGDQLWQGVDYVGLPYKETHQVRSMKITVLNRCRISKFPGLPQSGYTYIGGGFAGSFGLTDLYQRGPFKAEHASPFAGLVLNGGLYLSRNVALDMRYERGSHIDYSDYTIQDNRPPKSKGYSSIQGSILIEF